MPNSPVSPIQKYIKKYPISLSQISDEASVPRKILEEPEVYEDEETRVGENEEEDDDDGDNDEEEEEEREEEDDDEDVESESESRTGSYPRQSKKLEILGWT